MKLLNEEEISKWAFQQCFLENNNTEEIRDLITSEFWAFWYCYNIGDDLEIRKRITRPYYLERLKEKRMI